ncbi:MAG: MerR family transcriptional regulator [Bacteroidia bacterium]|jgi:DNA-binding transcriptional MerR regulator
MHSLNSKYSIKDLERLSGVKAHTIRIWEQRYNLLSPDRTDTNIRLYNDQDVKLLLNISLLIKNGGKISRLAQMSAQEITRQIVELAEKSEGKEPFFEAQINQMVLAMLQFDEDRFESTLNTSATELGFEPTMLNIIIPFLQRVGMMWLSGESSILQEHFISNMIRRKLLVAIDALPVIKNPEAEAYLLFLPEGELHELGLLFSKYLLKARGKRVMYLGQTLPREDVEVYCREHKPEYLLTFFTAAHSVNSINIYLNDLKKLSGKTSVLVAGMQLHQPDIKIPDGVWFITSVNDLIRLAEGKTSGLKTGTEQ